MLIVAKMYRVSRLPSGLALRTRRLRPRRVFGVGLRNSECIFSSTRQNFWRSRRISDGGGVTYPPSVIGRLRWLRPNWRGRFIEAAGAVWRMTVPDPIHTVDLSSLSALDKIEVDRLRAAYDRAGPRGVADGMADLAKTHPELFGWLVKKLTESP